MVEVKDRILDVAQALFVKRGVRNVNVDEICHELGISKKTFYQFYQSKEDLVGSMVDKHLHEINSAFESDLKGKDAIEVLIYVFNHRNKENFMVHKKIGDDIDKYYHDTFVAHTKKTFKYVREGMLKYIDRGIEEGYFRSDIDKEAMLLLLSMLHKTMVAYVEGEVITPGRRLSVHSLDQAYKDIVTHALLTGKGWEYYNNKLNEKDKN